MDDDGILKACTTNWRMTSARTMAKTMASPYSRTTDLAFRGLMLSSLRWTLPIFIVNPIKINLTLYERSACSAATASGDSGWTRPRSFAR